jgi:hypothetical protein
MENLHAWKTRKGENIKKPKGTRIADCTNEKSKLPTPFSAKSGNRGNAEFLSARMISLTLR